jgi:hypothetical protein
MSRSSQTEGRNVFSRSCCLIILVLLTVNGRAGTNTSLVGNYLPYLKGRPWPQFPITPFVEGPSNIWVHPLLPKKYPTVQEIAEDGADFATIVITQPDGTVLKTYNAFVLGPYLSAVYMGDFNSDGKPDFLAVKPGSGCGIAGENCVGAFAFSENEHYRFTRTWTMGLGSENLVQDPKTKTFRFIHSSLRSAKTADGRYHSFWVHRFFKWEGVKFDQDSDISPIWVQYLFRPNHEETKMLTREIKVKAWADDHESEASIEW